jgi:hypothetical protein
LEALKCIFERAAAESARELWDVMKLAEKASSDLVG